jgi:hypothetical protein
MSRVAVKDALVLAVSADTTLKAVEAADVPIVAQKLPCASVVFDGDERQAPGLPAGSHIYRFVIRLYVRLGKDLRAAERSLLGLADALDHNLQTHCMLTPTAEVIDGTDGTVDGAKYGEGPDLLCYEVAVRVAQRAPYDAELIGGGGRVVIRDVTTETYPTQPPQLEVLNDETGTLRAYIGRTAAETRNVAGRVETEYEAETLRQWLAESTELSYMDLRGVESTGWRIAGAPASRIARRNLSAETFDVDLTLWRI